MSNIRSVKQAFRQWLGTKVRIDQWDLDHPQKLFSEASTLQSVLPATSAISYPAKGMFYQREDEGLVQGFAAFTFSIVYRYAGSLTAEELPIDDIEAIGEFLYASALLELQGCNGIRQVLQEQAEFPVQITRTDDDRSDWLVYLHLVFEATFQVTEIGIPEGYGSLDPGQGGDFSLKQVDVTTYRALVSDLSTNILDADLSLLVNKDA